MTLPTDLAARDAGKKVILSIDDDPGVITLYKRYLEKQGYIVIGLTDPTKAVEEAKRLLPFAITLDVLMPNRDGWSVLADLKSAPEVNRTPIVMCSIIQDKTKGFTLGAAVYLINPTMEPFFQNGNQPAGPVPDGEGPVGQWKSPIVPGERVSDPARIAPASVVPYMEHRGMPKVRSAHARVSSSMGSPVKLILRRR